MKDRSARKKLGGVSAKRLVVPIAVALAALHLMIIASILMINSASSSLSAVMRDAGIYTQDATSLLAGSSLLSETASNYVLMPLTESGEVNAMPLMAYAQELGEDRRGPAVLERFQGYDVEKETLALVEQAAACAEAMREAQLRAIELMRGVYPLPDTPPLSAIPRVELTETELAMSSAERESAARTLVLGSVYAVNKQTVPSASTPAWASSRRPRPAGRRRPWPASPAAGRCCGSSPGPSSRC